MRENKVFLLSILEPGGHGICAIGYMVLHVVPERLAEKLNAGARCTGLWRGINMRIGPVALLGAAFAVFQAAWASPATFSVRQYGAIGDGKTLDTAAFNSAITACAAVGGGQVLVPPGRYQTGTIRLKSNITLLLDSGAEIVGTPDLEQYESFTPDGTTPSHWQRALVLGVGVENVTITGRGTINGNKVFDPHGEENMRGPHGVLFGNSRNIMLRDISIRDAGNYAVMLEFTSNVEVRGIKVTGGWDGVHSRGWKDRPNRNLTITDSEFYTGDDSIAGWFWENAVISRCILNSSCNGIRVIGPATRLIVHDCLFFGPGRFEHRTSRERHRTNMLAGIILQPGAWDPTEGRLDDVQISDITMHDVATPFALTLAPGNTAGRIELNRMTATGVYRTAASIESWAEQPVEKMILRDVNFEFQGGGSAERAGLPVEKPNVDARELPVWGLYVHKVRSLELQNVRLNLVEPDARPALMADNVEHIELDTFKPARSGVLPLAFTDVRELIWRDTDLKVVADKCVELQAGGSSFQATATIANGPEDGLTSVQVSVDGQSQMRWVAMRTNERKAVVFTGWNQPGPGLHTVRCGDLQKQILVP